MEMDKDWEEGLPWLLLVAREVSKESTGFSPNYLVFGHAVLQDDRKSPEPPQSLLSYVCCSSISNDACTLLVRWLKRSYYLHRGNKSNIWSAWWALSLYSRWPGSCSAVNCWFSFSRQVSRSIYGCAPVHWAKLFSCHSGTEGSASYVHANLLKPYYTCSSVAEEWESAEDSKNLLFWPLLLHRLGPGMVRRMSLVLTIEYCSVDWKIQRHWMFWTTFSLI